MGPRPPLKRGHAPGKTSKIKKSTKILEYQKDILAHIYVGNPLCTNSFLSPQAQAEGNIEFYVVIWD